VNISGYDVRQITLAGLLANLGGRFDDEDYRRQLQDGS